MTTVEAKVKIKQVLDEVPDELIPGILEYLLQIQHKTADRIKSDYHLKKIIEEDRALLERLAQ